MNIKEYICSHRLLADGAMGTYYEERYGREGGLAEHANETNPQRIKDIHLAYLRSGARLLRTNTFATNSTFFPEKKRVGRNIRKAFEIAREAVAQFHEEQPSQPVFIAADIGTIFDAEQFEYKQVLEEYFQICDYFLDCGSDCFLFETQSDFAYLEPISRYLKEQANAFVMAQFSFDKSGYTRSGLSVDKMMRTAAKMNTIDAYGFNCGMGATHMYQLLKDLTFPDDKYVSALPNAGYPYAMRGKLLYSGQAGYFVEEMKKIAGLGIDIVGGCCGTTPQHIQALEKALNGFPRQEKRKGSLKTVKVEQTRSAFERKLDSKKKVYIAELEPPFLADVEKVLDSAKKMDRAKLDLITLSDSPMARPRMDAGQLAVFLQSKINIPVMPHICCRDKNVLALRSGLLGTYMNQIRHYLIVTGDPVAREDREHVTSVFDLNSIKLMNYIHVMNEELFAKEPVFFGGALNYHGSNVEAILKRMQQKIENGCRFFLTQPIYTDADIARIHLLKSRVDTKILCGIMPLVSYKNALFMKNEMPGIQVSDEIVQRYRPDMDRKEAEETAIALSLEIAKKLMHVADGFYFMTPFNRAELICRIVNEIRSLEE